MTDDRAKDTGAGKKGMTAKRFTYHELIKALRADAAPATEDGSAQR